MLRRLALDILMQWEDGHSYADSLIDRAAREKRLSPKDRALLQAIVFGVLRNVSLLDFYIGELRDRKLDFKTRLLLRIGLCQLFILGLSEHAAVNETVKIAQKSTRGLVNACLRWAQRRKDELLAAAEEQPAHVRLSHPEWLVDRWAAAFGAENAEALMQWNQKPASTYARVNPLKEGAAAVFEASEVATAVDGAPGFYQVKGRIPPQWIEESLAYFQDPATRHAVDLLAPQRGETILDACAAPGGKACLIAAEMANNGKLLCTDSNELRLPRLQENLQNLGVTIAKMQEHDWREPAPQSLQGNMDGILLDVPCSNTGVLRRRVDARWRLTPQSISNVREIQLAILENAVPALAPGGRIVYSTCSIDAEENRVVIDAFLAAHPDFEMTAESVILPHEHGFDGAYAARLQRK